MPSFYDLSSAQLRQALQLREQIEALQEKLNSLLGTPASPSVAAPTKGKRGPGRTKGRRTMSPEARAKIGAAARARWAREKGTAKSSATKGNVRKPKKAKKSGLTAEGRAKLAASMKARWAARKKGAAAPNASAA